LDLVGAADPLLAQRLHAGSRRRPYTVSSLRGTRAERRGRVSLDPDQSVWLRFTSLEASLSEVLLGDVISHLPGMVSLGGAEMAVEGATIDAASHPWAAQSDHETLLEQHLLGSPRHQRKVRLQFASPTTFRRTGGRFEGRKLPDHDQPMPLPDLVFGSLADAWEAFAPVSLARDVRGFAARCLAVRRYRMQTRLVDDGRSRQAGAMGTCEYQVLSDDPLWLHLVHLLAAYSLFCGTGRGTAAGWGQTRPMHDVR
jgi:CRISPR-associated endoribonuclease Cas6